MKGLSTQVAPHREGGSVSLTSLSLSQRPTAYRSRRGAGSGRDRRTRRQRRRGCPAAQGAAPENVTANGSAGLVPGGQAEATPLGAQAIPVPGPRARVRARAAAPRGASGFAAARDSSTNCDASPRSPRPLITDCRAGPWSYCCRGNRALSQGAWENLSCLGSQKPPAQPPKAEKNLEFVPGTSAKPFPRATWRPA